MAQRKFAQSLGEFQFEYIGDAKTDDERCIGKCGFVSSHDGNQPLVLLHLQMSVYSSFTTSSLGAVVGVHLWWEQLITRLHMRKS